MLQVIQANLIQVDKSYEFLREKSRICTRTSEERKLRTFNSYRIESVSDCYEKTGFSHTGNGEM